MAPWFGSEIFYDTFWCSSVVCILWSKEAQDDDYPTTYRMTSSKIMRVLSHCQGSPQCACVHMERVLAHVPQKWSGDSLENVGKRQDWSGSTSGMVWCEQSLKKYEQAPPNASQVFHASRLHLKLLESRKLTLHRTSGHQASALTQRTLRCARG